MATITRFENLISWQKARILENRIYKIFEDGKAAKDFKLKNQINAASGSIMDNIAEGFERGGNIEFINFLSIAKGSSGEVKSQLYRSLDREYITKDIFDELYVIANDIIKLLASFMDYLNNSELKGLKFKDRINKKAVRGKSLMFLVCSFKAPNLVPRSKTGQREIEIRITTKASYTRR